MGLAHSNDYHPGKETFRCSRTEERSRYAEARQETVSKYRAQVHSSPWELKLGVCFPKNAFPRAPISRKSTWGYLAQIQVFSQPQC